MAFYKAQTPGGIRLFVKSRKSTPKVPSSRLGCPSTLASKEVFESTHTMDHIAALQVEFQLNGIAVLYLFDAIEFDLGPLGGVINQEAIQVAPA